MLLLLTIESTNINDLCHKLCFIFIVYGCVTAGFYAKIVFCNDVDNL